MATVMCRTCLWGWIPNASASGFLQFCTFMCSILVRKEGSFMKSRVGFPRLLGGKSKLIVHLASFFSVQ